ncbi:hypothetical protein F5146DRAFT_1171047 [Armillaria mellea]|nr:hypothetical protein F5146DRAFT_1171047 [Armillaria mellea]
MFIDIIRTCAMVADSNACLWLQNQEERYSCDECDLKFRDSTGLAIHRMCSEMHADTTNQQPESSSYASQGQDNPKEESATTPPFPDSTTEAPPNSLLDELIFSEWNDEFISKHFPALHAGGFRYDPEVPEMSDDFWLSILSSPLDFGDNGYGSFLDSSVDSPGSVTDVDEHPSAMQ